MHVISEEKLNIFHFMKKLSTFFILSGTREDRSVMSGEVLDT